MNVFLVLVLIIVMYYLCCFLDMFIVDLVVCFNRLRDFFKEIVK